MALRTDTFPAWLSGLHQRQIQAVPHIKTFLDRVPVTHGRPVTPARQLLWNELTTDATDDAPYRKMSPRQAQKKVDAYLVKMAKLAGG